MTGTGKQPRSGSLPLELHWDTHTPLPERVLISRHGRKPTLPISESAFHFTNHMQALCADVIKSCDLFAHIQMPLVLVSLTTSRNRSRFGLQARVTPLRFRDGSLTRRHGTTHYQVQRYFVNGQEMLYLLTFCLPRFLDQPFREKLVTVFHELYHVSPSFDGDIRRHPGRYSVHSSSKVRYDLRMKALVRKYLVSHPKPDVYRFLRAGTRQLLDSHGAITGVVVPRPKLLPVGLATIQTAARSRKNEE